MSQSWLSEQRVVFITNRSMAAKPKVLVPASAFAVPGVEDTRGRAQGKQTVGSGTLGPTQGTSNTALLGLKAWLWAGHGGAKASMSTCGRQKEA